MSVFTSRVTRTIEIPHDPGQKVNIRKLAPRHLEAASKEAQRQSLADLKAMGGPAFVKELQALTETQRVQIPDPMNLYDRIVLLAKAVTGWTYDEPADVASYEDLDEPTLNHIAREILTLSKPELFQTAEESAEARKNG